MLVSEYCCALRALQIITISVEGHKHALHLPRTLAPGSQSGRPGFHGMWKECKMGKLYLSIMIGALLMVAVEKSKRGDFSAGQMMATVQDAGQLLVSVQR